MLEYQEFPKSISFAGFNFSNCYDDERRILQPQLEQLGYSQIKWSTGDYDSCGPLTRVATCQKDGQTVRLMYG